MDGGIKLWNADTGRQLRAIVPGPSIWAPYESQPTNINLVAFVPDGKVLASGGTARGITLWDVATGKKLRIAGEGPVGSFTFKPDGEVMASAPDDTISPDGKLIASTSYDDALKRWTIKLFESASNTPLRSLQSDNDSLNPIAFSADGKLVAGVNGENTIALWDVASGKQLQSFYGYTEEITLAGFSPNGKMIGTLSGNYAFKLWDVATNTKLRSLEQDTDNRITSFAFSPDSKIIASTSIEGGIKLWDAASGKQFRAFPGGMSALALAFSPDGKIIASVAGMGGNKIELWDTDTGRQLRSLDAYAYDFAFSADGKLIASGSGSEDGGGIALWDVLTGKKVWSRENHTSFVNSVAFSPDGKVVASGSADDTIKLWSVANGKLLRSIFVSRKGLVNCIAFSPDGKTIVSGSYRDSMARLWDVATGRLLGSLAGHTGKVNSVAFSADGKVVISGSGDGTIRLWRSADNKPLATLIPLYEDEWVVVTPDGLFNASPGGEDYLHFVVNTSERGYETIELDQFKSRYYEPGLLQKLLSGEPVRKPG
jgi:WD40 repeat protein